MVNKNRKPNRLKNYDYSSPGLYFVTICIKTRENLFGKVKQKNDISLNEIGKVATESWIEIPKHFRNVELDEFVIMPNHIHGIISLKNYEYYTTNVGTSDRLSLRKYDLLPKIIGQFKSSVSRILHEEYDNHNLQWQRSYWDHIIRNDKSLNKIREYINYNPLNWNLDIENKKNYEKIKRRNFKKQREKYYKNLFID